MAAAGERARGEEGGEGVKSDGQLASLRYRRRVTDEPQNLKVENALLRASLYLTARR